jgi:hypothetical protein
MKIIRKIKLKNPTRHVVVGLTDKDDYIIVLSKFINEQDTIAINEFNIPSILYGIGVRQLIKRNIVYTSLRVSRDAFAAMSFLFHDIKIRV